MAPPGNALDALVKGVPGGLGEQVLQQIGDAAKVACRQVGRHRIGTRLLEALVDDRVEPRVELLDARDGLVDELEGADLAAPDQLGLGGRVQPGQLDSHR